MTIDYFCNKKWEEHIWEHTLTLEILNQLIGTSENCLAVSHARRFVKSQAAGMIDAYYSLGSDSKELFSPYEIATKADFETHLNPYNVIHIDVSSVADYHKDANSAIKQIKDRRYTGKLSDYGDKILLMVIRKCMLSPPQEWLKKQDSTE